MKIIEIDGNYIYAYMDGTFCIFSKNKVITGADVVGHAWAGGKAVGDKNPSNAPVNEIKKDTCYHNGLNMAFIKMAEAEVATPEN